MAEAVLPRKSKSKSAAVKDVDQLIEQVDALHVEQHSLKEEEQIEEEDKETEAARNAQETGDKEEEEEEEEEEEKEEEGTYLGHEGDQKEETGESKVDEVKEDIQEEPEETVEEKAEHREEIGRQELEEEEEREKTKEEEEIVEEKADENREEIAEKLENEEVEEEKGVEEVGGEEAIEARKEETEEEKEEQKIEEREEEVEKENEEEEEERETVEERGEEEEKQEAEAEALKEGLNDSELAEAVEPEGAEEEKPHQLASAQPEEEMVLPADENAAASAVDVVATLTPERTLTVDVDYTATVDSILLTPTAPMGAEPVVLERQPLTEAQLKSLYYNEVLANLEKIVDRFLVACNQTSHEFYDLVQSYLRALLRQRNKEECLRLLKADADRLDNRVWRKDKQVSSVKGRCMDNDIVTITFDNEVAVMNTEVLSELEEALRAIRAQLGEELPSDGYACQLSWLAIELYIHRLYMEAPLLQQMPKNAPAQLQRPPTRPNDRVQLERLKQVLSVLFCFHRKPVTDAQFVGDLRRWTLRLGSSLIRVGDSECHLFLLNHLLRCPSGFSKWASALVQPVLPALFDDRPHFQDELFDHSVAMLALLLAPIREREAMMLPMKSLLVPMTEGLSAANKGDALWVLVDSDGEAEEEGESGWHRLHENDLVALLGQMPVDNVFRHVLCITTDATSGEDLYQPLLGNTCSPATLFRVMAFVDQLLRVLKVGMSTYNMARYKQFNKRIARLVKHTVQFLTDHWEANAFVLRATGRHDQVPALQLQYEAEFGKAVSVLLEASKHGSWQYLADFPYRMLSAGAKRAVLLKYFSGDDMSALEERIPSLPTAECIYLMTTLSNLGRDCNVSVEAECAVINEIVDAIFHLSFVCPTTRLLCAKVGRELLTGMALRHSYLLSRIVDLVRRSIRQLEKVSVFLFRELPFHLYNPSPGEVELLTSWLLNSPMDSVENQLTRCVLSGMNWSGAPQGADLQMRLHHDIALMLVRAFAEHTSSKTWTAVVMDSTRHLSGLLRLTGPSSDTTFFAWTVHTVTRLRPHWTAWDPDRAGERVDYRQGGRWSPILEGVRAGNPLALFVAVIMMPHCDGSPGGTMETTMDYLLQLLKQCHYRLVIEGLRHFVLLCVNHLDFLVKSEKFSQILVSLLRADQSYFQTFKKFLVDDFPGVLLSAMVVMMLDLSLSCAAVDLLGFWMRVLVKVPQWVSDRNCLFALDRLLQHSLMRGVERCMMSQQGQPPDEAADIMTEAYQAYVDDCVQTVRRRRGWSALMNMGAAFAPWYSDGLARESPYVAFYLLRAHERVEDRLGLWPLLQQKLSEAKAAKKPRQVTDTLPEVTKAVDFPLVYPPTVLSIYLWGGLVEQLAGERSSHPLLAMAGHRFFLRFFARDSGRWLGSLGLYYFETRAQTTQLKQWRTAVKNAAASLMAKANESDEENPNAFAEFHRRRSLLLDSMSLWFDEPRLHDSSLLLSALPPQYDSERLAAVFEGNETLWLDLFLLDELFDLNLKSRLEHWRKRHDIDWSLEALGRLALQDRQTPKDRILSRLRRQMNAVEAPDLEPIRPPVPNLGIECLTDRNALIVGLREPIDLLVSQAKAFVEQQNRTTALDLQYLEGLRNLMTNRTVDRTLTKPCQRGLQIAGVRAYGGCAGPAVVSVRVQECARDDVVWTQLESNRSEFLQLLAEGTGPPPRDVMLASLFVDNAIDCLLALAQSSAEALSIRTSALEAGIALFYHLASFFTEDTKTYPPTRHFLTETLEKLGHALIRDNPAETGALLTAVLKAPHQVEILSPHFSPVANPQTFVELYRRLLGVAGRLGPEITFSLLSKFEVRDWLRRGQPPEERDNFLRCVCEGLRHCGKRPSPQLTIVYEVYKAHLRSVLKTDLVFFVAPAMKLCLQLAVDAALCPDVWHEFFTLLNTKSDKAGELGMPTEQLQAFIDELAGFFKAQRQTHLRTGLFKHWAEHAVVITEIFSFLLGNLTMKLARAAVNKHIDPQQALNHVWTAALSLFTPWVGPQIVRNAGGVPWMPEENGLGASVLQVFTRFLTPLHENFHQLFQQWTSSIICQRLWLFYSKELINSNQIPDYLVEAYVTALSDISLWQGWMADTAVLSDMNQLLRARPTCLPSRRLIVRTLSRMGWADLHNPGSPFSEQLDYSDFLFNLCVCLLGGKEAGELLKTEEADQLLEQILKLPWLGLSASTFDLALRWFVTQSDGGRGLVCDSVAPEAKLFRLFIVGAGMVGDSGLPKDVWEQPPGSPSQATVFNLLNKQVCCLRAQVQLLQQGASKFQGSEAEAKRFSTALINFLTQAEATVAAIPKHEPRMNHGLLVANECLNLLRNCTPSRVREILRVYKEWLASSSSSPLLLPLLHSVCANPPSLHIAAILAEEAIGAYITAPHCDASWQSWGTLASTMTLDILKVGDFVREAVANCCLLCLFVHQLQQAKIGEAGTRHPNLTKATRICEWMSSVDLRPEDEAKCILLWDRLLDLVIQVSSDDSCGNQCLVLLNNWVAQLGAWSEDKSSAGLLGMIGLGRRSSLSIEYRFLCRAMAAFVMAQIPTNHVLRNKPNAPGHLRPEMTVTARPIGAVLPTNQALIAIRALRQLKTNKAYVALYPWVAHTLDFIGQPEHSILQAQQLLRRLALEVFRGVKLIEVLRS